MRLFLLLAISVWWLRRSGARHRGHQIADADQCPVQSTTIV
jgi:hypothetical protein